MNYLVVVNKSNLINEDYYKDLELVKCEDILGDIISVEKKTYEAYVKLKDYLKTKNIIIELDSAYRSIEEQQIIIDDYKVKYGLDYVKKYKHKSFEESIYVPFLSCSTGIKFPGLFFSSKYICYVSSNTKQPRFKSTGIS